MSFGLHPWIHFLIGCWGWGWARPKPGPGPPSGLPMQWQGPRQLGHPGLFSQAHQQGAGSTVGQPGLQNGVLVL